MSLTRKQIALLHVAKTKLGFADADYRAVLVNLAGVTSSKDLDPDGFTCVMGFFEYCGFQPLHRRGEDFGARKGMASFAQIELIRALWAEYTRETGEDALNKWLLRSFKVSSLRFLTKRHAQGAITALKAMKARAA